MEDHTFWNIVIAVVIIVAIVVCVYIFMSNPNGAEESVKTGACNTIHFIEEKLKTAA